MLFIILVQHMIGVTVAADYFLKIGTTELKMPMKSE